MRVLSEMILILQLLLVSECVLLLLLLLLFNTQSTVVVCIVRGCFLTLVFTQFNDMLEKWEKIQAGFEEVSCGGNFSLYPTHSLPLSFSCSIPSLLPPSLSLSFGHCSA